MVPVRSYQLHSIHCERFLTKCTDCLELLPKSRLSEHVSEKHTKFACEYCQDTLPKETMEGHVLRCEFRPQACRYCQAVFTMVSLVEHQEFCGNRTEICPACSRYVPMKDFATHTVVECPSSFASCWNLDDTEPRDLVQNVRKRKAQDEGMMPSKRFKRGY